jgi:uncharacterized membrane protein
LINYSLYQFIWIFIVYAFFGWCLEVILTTVKTRKFINRGFLNGPFCPIYGFGVLAVLILLVPIKNNLLLLFVGSIFITTFIEFFTGLILEVNFRKKWWDYTGQPFNLMGYVCLRTSIIWGLSCIVVVYALQPIINKFVDFIPKNGGMAILALFLIFVAVDLVVTIVALLKIKKKIQILEDTGIRMKSLSDAIGKNISVNTINAIEMRDKRFQELDDLNKKYQAILYKKVFGYNRLDKAFPKLHLIKPKKSTKSLLKSK